jgi:hypothetical protein
MPVILRSEAEYARWLDPEITTRAPLEGLMKPLEDGALIAAPKSSDRLQIAQSGYAAHLAGCTEFQKTISVLGSDAAVTLQRFRQDYSYACVKDSEARPSAPMLGDR